MSSRDRVVITGIGLVTPLGADRESSWAAVRAGRCAARVLDIEPHGGRPYIGAPAPEECVAAGRGRPPRAHAWRARVEGGGQRSRAKQAASVMGSVDGGRRGAGARRGSARVRVDAAESAHGGADHEPIVALALRAAEEAVCDARLEWEFEDRGRMGCVIGCSKGGLHSFGEAHRAYYWEGRVPAGLWEGFWPHVASSRVAAAYGLEGPVSCPAAACATGTVAVVQAANLIRDGYCDVVLAGAADASVRLAALATYRQMGVLSEGEAPEGACRPFERRRRGFFVGEGAGVLVLERLDRARERGATIYAELAGSACGSDAHHLTDLDSVGDGLAYVIGQAMRRAGVAADEVDYVNAHGTGTRQNDVVETRALERALGAAAYWTAVSSTKAMTGHLLGAAGSVELAITALAMRDGYVPATINLEEPDPECDLDYTPLVGREQEVRVAVKTSLAFGGHLAAVVLRRVSGEW